MTAFKIAFFLLLLAAGACFALYMATGKPHYQRWGLVVLKWTVIAALGFFGVLIAERLL